MSSPKAFSYKAIQKDGDLSIPVNGFIEASDAGEAAAMLIAKNLVPLEIEETSQTQPGSEKKSRIAEKKADPLDAMVFSQQMGILLKSGVPITRALAGIVESAANEQFKKAVAGILANLEAGKPLSICLSKHPGYFSDYYISMIKIGEMTGKLDDIFLKLHDHLDFQRIMKAQVKSATRYPAIVISAMAVAILIINFFVIPTFAKVYAGFKAELPIFTKILIGTSNFMVNNWFWCLAAIVASVFAFKQWTSAEAGRLAFDRMKLRFPIAGKIIHKATMARFCRSLALAMEAGVPIGSSLAMVAESSDNEFIRQKLMGIKTQIERGEGLYRSCQQTGAFTSLALQMILVGEESGNLDAMLNNVAELYQSQVEYELKTLGSQIEPILILFLGALVVVLALGVFLPVWNLSEAAFKK